MASSLWRVVGEYNFKLKLYNTVYTIVTRSSHGQEVELKFGTQQSGKRQAIGSI